MNAPNRGQTPLDSGLRPADTVGLVDRRSDMDTIADKDTGKAGETERVTFERVRARNRLTSSRAERRAAEIRRASKRSKHVVEQAVEQLRSAGVIR